MTDIIAMNFAKKCAECHKGGAMPNGLCLTCNTSAVLGAAMTSKKGQDAQRRYESRRRALSREMQSGRF